jgi:hypothetical protein
MLKGAFDIAGMIQDQILAPKRTKNNHHKLERTLSFLAVLKSLSSDQIEERSTFR